MKNLLGKILSAVIVVVIVAFVGYGVYQIPFIIGSWSNKVEQKVGTEYKNIKREQFEQTKSYVHGKTEDLQRYKRELDTTTDKVERLALIAHIQDEFAAFDESKLDNNSLRKFLDDVRNGFIK